MVYEEANTLVHRKLLHQRCPDAHGHGADHLTACRLRVQNSSRGAHGEHASYPAFTGCGVNSYLDKMCAEGRLAVLLVKVAKFDEVLGNDAFARDLSERHTLI